MTAHTAVVLGASNKTDRYSYKAMKLLIENGVSVIPVHPVLKEIEGISCVPNLAGITTSIDTLTVYIGADRMTSIRDDIIKLNPGRVIFNPGTENNEVIAAIEAKGIKCLRACTLVMLKTGQFFL